MNRVGGYVAMAALLAMGCGSDPSDRSLAQGEQLADVVCACPSVVGASSESECRSGIEESMLSDAEEACVRRAYAAYQAELDPVLDCQYQASEEYRGCMAAALEMCPPDSSEAAACGEALGMAFGACPSASEQAQAELNACFASRM